MQQQQQQFWEMSWQMFNLIDVTLFSYFWYRHSATYMAAQIKEGKKVVWWIFYQRWEDIQLFHDNWRYTSF